MKTAPRRTLNQPHTLSPCDTLQANEAGLIIPTVVPEILAPAGDTSSFLAALAAGADAVYVGLKHFSARAGADNFSLTELSRMVNLAQKEERKVYIAFNTMVKPEETESAGRLMVRLARDVHPHALIIQDPGLVEIARQAGYEGQLHFSTLGNLSHAKALEAAQQLGASRVILPRELSLDEIRTAAAQAPEGLDLELFIHGALCWCVSGRCYWSSYLGGKSGLRGRCVQPCRRIYRQKGREGRFFSSRDLSLDVLTRTLLDIPQLTCWKIEGRKKGPHYVYHTVAAYRLLLDSIKEGTYSAKTRKNAEELLTMALGRPGTHARFLPQNAQPVSSPEEPTSSGLLVGKIQFSQEAAPHNAPGKKNAPNKQAAKNAKPEARRGSRIPGPSGRPYFKPRQDLLPGDIVRIGYEDEAWHETLRVTRRIPKAGQFALNLPQHKTPKAGTPVFLIDRREPELAHILQDWECRLARAKGVTASNVEFALHLPPVNRIHSMPNITVLSSLPQGRQTKGSRGSMHGLWISPNMVRAVSRTVAPRLSWWLPPVIWPEEEGAWQRALGEALRNGARHFVCNSPWQAALFPTDLSGLELVAGPFCNLANAAAMAVMQQLGFCAAFVSPELSREDLLALPRQSCLPLGLVTEGYWPVGISRHRADPLKANEGFTSPMGENFWIRNYGQTAWIYPGWPLDITSHEPELQNAGYAFFGRLRENPPQSLPLARRSSEFNWSLSLL